MNTLRKTVAFKGVGLHSGQEVHMTVSPANDSGITFHLNGEDIIVSKDAIGLNHMRATSLTNGSIQVQTPEHFLAACYALSLTNILVTLDHPEVPILDGSAIEFIHQLKPNMVAIESTSQSGMEIKDDAYFTCNGSHYYACPSDQLKITAVISYPNHWVKSMSYTYIHSLDQFIMDIAPARTYGFSHELDELNEKGLAKGGSLDNVLVVGGDDYLNPPRFSDELVRHKILDFMGDMAIGGKKLRGQFVIIRPSHQGNCEFLKQL